MSNTPTVPTVGSLVQSELSALAHKQLTVTYSVLAVLVLVLSLACVGGIFGFKAYEAQVARAEVQEQKFDQDRSDFLKQLQADEVARAQDAKDAADRLAQIAARDAQPLKPTSPAVSSGLKPDATAQEAANGLSSAYPGLGVVDASPDGKVLTTVQQTQFLMGFSLQAARDREDLADLKVAYADQVRISQSEATDLGSCKTALVEAQKTIGDYKKIATKSGWRKFLDGAEKVGLVLAGAAIGHMI